MSFPKYPDLVLDNLNKLGYNFKKPVDTTVLTQQSRDNISSLSIKSLAIKVEDCYGLNKVIGVLSINTNVFNLGHTDVPTKRNMLFKVDKTLLHLTIGKAFTLVSNEPVSVNVSIDIDIEKNKLLFDKLEVLADNPDISYEIIGIEYNY